MEADLADYGAVGLEFGPSIAGDLVHFIVSVPRELDGIAVTGSVDGAVTQPKANLPPPLPSNRMYAGSTMSGKSGV